MSFTEKVRRFLCQGLDLTFASDDITTPRFPLLKNVRSYQLGKLESRPGLTTIDLSPAPYQNPVHSIRRLNDGPASTWARIIGVENKVCTGQISSPLVPATDILPRDDNYSGDPLAMVPFRPDQSVRPWMYVSDRSRMRKFRSDGTVHKIGLPPPSAPPTIAIDTPKKKVIENSGYQNDAAVATAWIEEGAAATTPPEQLDATRVNTTVRQILYDNPGSAGWASVMPVALTASLTPGTYLRFDRGEGDEELVVVQSVHPAIITPTTIDKILYKLSPESTECSIVLKDPYAFILQDTLLRIGGTAGAGGGEYVRVASVTRGPDGHTSIGTSTAGTQAATNRVDSENGVDGTTIGSFRAYFANVQEAGNVIESTNASGYPTGVRSQMDFSAGPTGSLTKLAVMDLSQLESDLVSRLDDYIHIAVRFSDIGSITEGRVEFDVNRSVNGFDENYYTFPFRPSDITAAVGGTETFEAAKESTIRSDLVDNASRTDVFTNTPIGDEKFERLGEIPLTNTLPFPYMLRQNDPSGGVLAPGSNQWLDLKFRVRDLIRVGTDTTRTLKDVQAIRLSITITADVIVDFDSWWIGGGYGPDTNNLPYVYRYRGRSSLTGVKGNFSPPTRTLVSPYRQAVTVTMVQHPDTTEVDKLDVERFGGTVQGWRYVGSTENESSPSFQDIYADVEILSNPSLGNNNFQPWATIGAPTGDLDTIAVSGTLMSSGADFNTSWAPGTVIYVDGQPMTVYRVHSTSLLETRENAGAKGVVKFAVHEPILQDTDLPVFWGPWEGTMFAVGDTNNPGRLYFSNNNDPDSTLDTSWIDITSPSEPLQNGCTYNTRCYVFSSERLFAVYRDTGPSRFHAVEVPNSKGLFNRWALAVGPSIYFLSRDGIYSTEGSSVKSLTDGALRPLFPHEGQSGKSFTGIRTPDMDVDPTKLRLSWYDDYLYFDYVDASSDHATLVWSLELGGWFYDEYPDTQAVTVHYGEEGDSIHSLLVGTDHILTDQGGRRGALAQVAGTSDLGKDGEQVGIVGQIRTPSLDIESPRTKKLWGDLSLELDSETAAITAEVGLDNHSNIVSSQILNTADRSTLILDLDDGGVEGRNISLDLTWDTATSNPQFYSWVPTFETRPEDSTTRATDYEEAGSPGNKQFRALLLTADTEGVERIIQILYDGDQKGPLLRVRHSGKITIAYGFTPFTAHQIKFAPQDNLPWKLYSHNWIFDAKSETALVHTDWSNAGDPSEKYVQGVLIEADTQGEIVSVEVYRDGGILTETLSISHDGQSSHFYPFATPFLAHTLKLAPQGPWQHFSTEWAFTRKPELTALVNDWTNDGVPGSKFLQGFILEADTQGKSVTLRLELDGGIVHQDIVVNHPGQSQKPYSLTDPQIAHLFRIYPISGDIRIFSQKWIWTPKPEYTSLVSDWSDGQFDGPKYLTGLVIEADTNGLDVPVRIEADGGVLLQEITINHDGQLKVPYALSDPSIVYTMRAYPSSGDWRLFNIQWKWSQKVDDASYVGDWDHADHVGAKLIQGFILEADTGGRQTTLSFDYDGNQSLDESITISHDGQSQKSYSFNDPFVAHVIKVIPSHPWRPYRLQWIWEPVPESARVWETPPLSPGISGYGYIRDLYLAHDSTKDLSLEVTLDGVPQPPIPTSASGGYQKSYVLPPVWKFKSIVFRISSSDPFRLYQRDCEVRIKSWGSGESFSTVRPFGGPSVASGARI